MDVIKSKVVKIDNIPYHIYNIESKELKIPILGIDLEQHFVILEHGGI